MSTLDNFRRSLGSIEHILVSESQPDFILPVTTCLRNLTTEIFLGSIVFHCIKVIVAVILQKTKGQKKIYPRRILIYHLDNCWTVLSKIPLKITIVACSPDRGTRDTLLSLPDRFVTTLTPLSLPDR